MSNEEHRHRPRSVGAEDVARSEMLALRARLCALNVQKRKLVRQARALRKQITQRSLERVKLKVRMRNAEREPLCQPVRPKSAAHGLAHLGRALRCRPGDRRRLHRLRGNSHFRA
jgi:hypothetical protein